MNESGGDPNATTGGSSASGLFQIIRSTYVRFNNDNMASWNDRFDPKHNIDTGLRFLEYLEKKYHGNQDLVLTHYHGLYNNRIDTAYINSINKFMR